MARQPRRRTTTAPREAPATPRRARLRENLPRPTAPALPTAATRPQPVVRRSRLAFLKRVQPRFAADIISELRKVTWPTMAETRYLSIVVSIVAIVVGIFLGAIDLFFGWGVERHFL